MAASAGSIPAPGANKNHLFTSDSAGCDTKSAALFHGLWHGLKVV